MFEQARLKLTGWYLLIIMLVSLAFTSVIYRAATFELNRFAGAQRAGFERRVFVSGGEITTFPAPPQLRVDDELIAESKNRLLRTLALINLGIMSVAGILGYYLSGKTLSPIQEMMDEQYRFISDASHELKTPITAMKSTLEVSLRDKKMELPEARQTLETGLEQVNRLQKLAEGLLELSGHQSEPKMVPIELHGVIQEAITATLPVAQLRHIEIEKRSAKATIMGERETLTRAIVVVIDNAIKYSKPKSRIHVSSKVSSKGVVLSVRDEGEGISEEDLPLIFNRFYRGDKARSTDGHGLGLAIAKKIIESQQGSIIAASQKGKGTTITMTFPYSARIQH